VTPLDPAYASTLDPPWTSWTKLQGWIDVDFRNSGREETLALLDFQGTAGRGCYASYYVPAPQQTPMSEGNAHALLMKLQNVDPKAFFPVPTCGGNQTRWFTYNGRTYLDVRAAGQLTDYPMHEVGRLQGNEVERICRGTFTPIWRVASYWPFL
jgi:hypothetical protein